MKTSHVTKCSLAALQYYLIVDNYDDEDYDDDDDDDDDDELFLWYCWSMNGVSFISSRGHCQRSLPSQISDTPQGGFEPAKNLSSGFVESTCAVVIATTSRCHKQFMPECHAFYHQHIPLPSHF